MIISSYLQVNIRHAVSLILTLTMTPWHQWFVAVQGIQGTPSKPDNVAGMVGAAAFTGIPWP